MSNNISNERVSYRSFRFIRMKYINKYIQEMEERYRAKYATYIQRIRSLDKEVLKFLLTHAFNWIIGEKKA